MYACVLRRILRRRRTMLIRMERMKIFCDFIFTVYIIICGFRIIYNTKGNFYIILFLFNFFKVFFLLCGRRFFILFTWQENFAVYFIFLLYLVSIQPTSKKFYKNCIISRNSRKAYIQWDERDRDVWLLKGNYLITFNFSV